MVVIPFLLFGFFLLSSLSVNAQNYVPLEKSVEIVDNYKQEFYKANPILSAKSHALPASAQQLKIKAEFLELFVPSLDENKASGLGATLNGISQILINDRGYSQSVVNGIQQEIDQLLRL